MNATRFSALAGAVLLSLSATLPAAEAGVGFEALRALGRLNGLALQCGYLQEVRRMKHAMVEYAPKTRAHGAAFEEGTNAGFMAFLEEGSRCPGPATLEQRVDAAVAELAKAFAAD